MVKKPPAKSRYDIVTFGKKVVEAADELVKCADTTIVVIEDYLAAPTPANKERLRLAMYRLEHHSNHLKGLDYEELLEKDHA